MHCDKFGFNSPSQPQKRVSVLAQTGPLAAIRRSQWKLAEPGRLTMVSKFATEANAQGLGPRPAAVSSRRVWN